jgi:hypothetical protein
VDWPVRVKNAERAMAKVKAKVKWLSLEPMLERLNFSDLSQFQWVVIGGASESSKTPEWRPPREWVWGLSLEARAAGCRVYHKTNLRGPVKDFPWWHEEEPIGPPAEFYLPEQRKFSARSGARLRLRPGTASSSNAPVLLQRQAVAIVSAS